MGSEKVASLTWEVVKVMMGKGTLMMWCGMGRRSVGALALLFGLIAGYGPQLAEAQVTFTQITNTTGSSLFYQIPDSSPSINADGTRIAFNSWSNPTGGNPDGNMEIFLWTQGSGITQITNSSGSWTYNDEPSINADGTRIAFRSDSNPTGGNADGSEELFLWTEGSGFTQITNGIGRFNPEPSINADGTRIAFRSDSNPTGGNPDGSTELFLWTQGSGFTQITSSIPGSYSRFNTLPSINADGTRIVFVSQPRYGNVELFLWTQGSGFTQITSSIPGSYLVPSINADGTRITFSSRSDLTGGNPDGSLEIFLWTQGSGITQITSSSFDLSILPSINADGTRIAFRSDSNLTGNNADGDDEIFLWTQGSGITQITNSTWGETFSPHINANGTRIAFISSSNPTGGNPDRNDEVFLATLSDAPTGPVLSSPLNEATGVSITPTFVWSAVTGANRYWLMVATSPTDLPTDPNATTCPNCVISGSTDVTSYAAPHTFPFGGRSGTLSTNTTYYWKVMAYNTNGTLATYSSTFRFTTGQPELTEPDRREIVVNECATPTPASNAVVITHGWISDASTWVRGMAEDICKKLDGSFSPTCQVNANTATKVCQVNDWDVWVYDWRTDADEIVPRIAYVKAIPRGARLSTILRDKDYEHIHFVAHSAGAKLIDTATLGVKLWAGLEGRSVKIHETFLDAYGPAMEQALYGGWADWADNYVDTRDIVSDYVDGTKLFLTHAYNINVTPDDFLLEVIPPQDCLIPPDNTVKNQYRCRHSRPYRFYGLSITGMGEGSFVGNADDKQADPIDSTVGMGYPLSVENGHTLTGDPNSLANIFKPGGRCIVQGGICSPVFSWLDTLNYLGAATEDVVVEGVTTAVEYVQGAGAYVFNSVKLGWAWVAPGLAPQQTLGVRQSATAAATTTEAPSYLAVNVTTTTLVNTLRFNWSFATAGEGLLRVFVGGNLVREIDQRHVTHSSPETEEVYIGGDGVSLPAGTHRITFRFDGFGASASGVELTDVELGMLMVVSPMTISTTALPTGEKGVAYAYALQAEGGTPPYTWSRIKGKLPKGVTLDAAGTLSGIPTKAKTATFTVQVTDATAASATQTFSLKTVKPVTLKTKRLGQGKVGTPYAATLKTKGGISPLTFSLVGGALPPDLTIDPATGQISGTPVAVGTFDFQVRVDSSGGSSDQRSIRITIK